MICISGQREGGGDQLVSPRNITIIWLYPLSLGPELPRAAYPGLLLAASNTTVTEKKEKNIYYRDFVAIGCTQPMYRALQ